jgi:hypothetical protein
MAPQRTRLSAREAAAAIGFATANPILSAIKSGDLPAEKLPGRTRNGRNSGAYRILYDDLLDWTRMRGIEWKAPEVPAEAAAPEPIDQEPQPAVAAAPAVQMPSPQYIRLAGGPSEVLVSVPLALLLDLQARAVGAEARAENEQPVMNRLIERLDQLEDWTTQHYGTLDLRLRQVEKPPRISKATQPAPVEAPAAPRRRRGSRKA